MDICSITDVLLKLIGMAGQRAIMENTLDS